ncbi:MAG: hypothetical protein E6618_15105, partial [Staphylococcus warneri]|nr:hypothetical protein [Staphylococcus warneri]
KFASGIFCFEPFRPVYCSAKPQMRIATVFTATGRENNGFVIDGFAMRFSSAPSFKGLSCLDKADVRRSSLQNPSARPIGN